LAAALEEVKRRDPRAIYAAARFEVAKAGAISFKLEGPDAALVWVDGKRVDGCATFKPDLAVGKHTVVVRLEAMKLPETMRLESSDATFLTN
jgi:adenylylsulfate kinase-like enzyme